MTVKVLKSRLNNPIFWAWPLKETNTSNQDRSDTSPCSAECWKFRRVCRTGSLGHQHSSCPSSGLRRPATPVTRLAPSSRCPENRTIAPHSASTTDFLQQQIRSVEPCCQVKVLPYLAHSISFQVRIPAQRPVTLFYEFFRSAFVICFPSPFIFTLQYFMRPTDRQHLQRPETKGTPCRMRKCYSSVVISRSRSCTGDFRLPPRNRWHLRSSGLLRSVEW